MQLMMKSGRPHIAVIAPSAPPLGGGGVASSHFHLYRCLKRRGLDAVLLTYNETKSGEPEADIFRYGASPLQRSLLALCSALYLKARGSHKTAYQLADILVSIPGVLRLHRVLRQLRPQRIIIPDHGAPGLLLDKGNGRLIMVTHHNPSRFINNPLLEKFCPIDVHEAMKLEQRVLAKVDGVVAPSAYMQGVFQDTFRFGGPVAMIHNPLDLSLIDAVQGRNLRAELGLSVNAPLVYIPSADSIFKGACYVSGIVQRLSASCAGKIGFYLSGPCTDGLIQELNAVADNVIIFAPGQLGYPEHLAFVKTCSFGISPTLIESFGMAILEAVVCGVPMVVFRTGGTGEIVSDGNNGFCVPCHDLEQLCAVSARFLVKEYAQEMAHSSYIFSRKQFDADKAVDAYLRFCGLDSDGTAISTEKEAI